MACGLNGKTGHDAVPHVALEFKSERGFVTILRLQMVVSLAKEREKKRAIAKFVTVHKMDNTVIGYHGKSAQLVVGKDLENE